MHPSSRLGLLPGLMLGALLAWPCLALAQSDPSAPIANGPSGAPPVSTTPVPPLRTAKAQSDPDAGQAAPPRRPYGEVDVSVGTGGYRSFAGVVTAPIGQDGSVTIAADQVTGPSTRLIERAPPRP